MNMDELSNQYYLMRHGNSLANQAGIIVSSPENGVGEYGLSTLGKEQVNQSIRETSLPDDLVIYSSDFKRARETAEIVMASLDANLQIRLDKRLRERNFGQFELGSDNQYPKVWALDVLNPDHTEHQVESVNQVLSRTVELIIEIERDFQNRKVLLTAHGDVLQIMQTKFEEVSASDHRSLTPIETAEIRRVN
jgi:broad specificity phosphatase PhoE